MGLQITRLWTGLALVGSGVLMYAAAGQRWAGACPWWGGGSTRACDLRSDHRYDFLVPTEPRAPVGHSATLGGLSLVLLAVALVTLPWAISRRRPGPFAVTVTVGAAAATALVGAQTLLSGMTGAVVKLPFSGPVTLLWLLAPVALFGWLSGAGRGWARAAAVFLILSAPLVAGFSYAVGSFDAQPWWEAVCGTFTVFAGLCLLVAVVRLAAIPSPAGPSGGLITGPNAETS